MRKPRSTMTPEELAHVRRLDAAKSARYRRSEKGKRTLAAWHLRVGRDYKAEWMRAKRLVKPLGLRPLTDGYVRETLTSRSAVIKKEDVPQLLVELQKQSLQLKRELRKTK